MKNVDGVILSIVHAMDDESSQEWFAEGMLFKPEFSLDELHLLTRDLMGLWEEDNAYGFYILDASTNQVGGYAFLNRIIREYKLANLGYQVRTSRMGEGIATAAAKLVAEYGFEKLGFQRIEIVVRKENAASLRVAEKLGAVREGLLRNRLQHHGSACDAYMHSLIPSDYGIHQTA